jgi:sarcosine/dimethylglycine N-methyltransferase
MWDIVAGPQQPIHFPVPWALEPELSHLVTADELREVCTDAGFEVRDWSDLTEISLTAMDALLAAPTNPLGNRCLDAACGRLALPMLSPPQSVKIVHS